MLKNILSTITTYAKTAWEYIKATVIVVAEIIVEQVTKLTTKSADQIDDSVVVVVVDETAQTATTEGGVMDTLFTSMCVCGAIYLVLNIPITILLIMECYFVTQFIVYILKSLSTVSA